MHIPETKPPWESWHEARRKKAGGQKAGGQKAEGRKKYPWWLVIIFYLFIVIGVRFGFEKWYSWVEQNVRPVGEAEEAAIPLESPDAEGDK